MTDRPLSARSVIAGTLLGMARPTLRSSLIVRWCACFGIAEGTTRTALSRMVAAGELVADDGTYSLGGPLLATRRRQGFSRRPVLRDWDGDWACRMVNVGARSAAERAELRRDLRHLHFAELRDGCWIRPDNLAPDAAEPAAVATQCRHYVLRPVDDDPTALAAALFDLDGWSAVATTRLAALTAAERDPDDLARQFTAASLLLAHVRTDPLLPDALVPTDWPGTAVRVAYDAWEERFTQRWREWATRR
jgi:phenylacetic acid degradation operon negative regulatory protein